MLEAPAGAQGSDAAVHGARRTLALPPVRTLASSIGASVAAGLLIGGLGSRVVMRLSAIAADGAVQGAITENGNRVGEITAEGTIGLLLFGGLFSGLAAGPLVFAVRTVAPRRWLPLWLTATTIAFGGHFVLDPGNADFVVLGNRALNVALFLALFPAFSMLAIWLAERLDRWLLQPPLVHLAPLAIPATALGAILAVLALVSLGVSDGGGLTMVATAGIVVTVAFATAAVTDRARSTLWGRSGGATLAVVSTIGLVEVADGVMTIL